MTKTRARLEAAESAAGQSTVTANQSVLAAEGRFRARSTDRPNVIVLGRAEAQEGRDISYVVEFGIILYVENFDVMADHPGQYCLGHVDYLASLASADGTEANQVRVEVAAAGALHGLRDIGIANQQGLYFAHFERAQHAAQSGDAAAVAAGLAEGLMQRFARAALLPVGENPFGLRANFIAAHMSNLGGEPA